MSGKKAASELIYGRRRSARTALVIQPDEHSPLGLYSTWLDEAGVSLRVVKPFVGEPVPAALEEDGLIVLGGEMGANDGDRFPWIADVKELIKKSVQTGAPALGICLGGQLLAQALGGTVERGAFGREHGVVDLEIQPEAADDALFAGLATPTLMATSHGDAITKLPLGAVLLASSRVYPNQAFRCGPRAWGVQFHPEVSAEMFAQWDAWVRHDTPDPDLPDEASAERVNRHQSELAKTGQLLARRFAALIRS